MPFTLYSLGLSDEQIKGGPEGNFPPLFNPEAAHLWKPARTPSLPESWTKTIDDYREACDGSDLDLMDMRKNGLTDAVQCLRSSRRALASYLTRNKSILDNIVLQKADYKIKHEQGSFKFCTDMLVRVDPQAYTAMLAELGFSTTVRNQSKVINSGTMIDFRIEGNGTIRRCYLSFIFVVPFYPVLPDYDRIEVELLKAYQGVARSIRFHRYFNRVI